MKIAGLAVSIAILSSSTIVAAQTKSDLTVEHIFAKSVKAYSALKSYHSTVRAESVMGSGSMTTTGEIWYASPGKIRVAGTMLGGNGRFDFLSDGNSTWEKSNITGEKWKPVSNPQSALARYSGVSGGTAACVPPILMRSRYGNPYISKPLSPNGATIEMLDGVKVYKYTTISSGTQTFWIDAKTFLLRKRMMKGMRLSQTLTYEKIDADKPIAASVFVKPGVTK